MAKLLLLFTVVPLMEVYLLFVLGQHMGFWPTVALVLVTGVLGAILGKREGLKVWHAWRDALSEGRLPEEGILGGVLVLVGGVLLVTPGVLTDVAGLLLLVPPSRRLIARAVRAYLEKRFASGQAQATFRYRVDMGGGRVVEGLRTHFGASAGVIDTEGEVVAEQRRNQAELES